MALGSVVIDERQHKQMERRMRLEELCFLTSDYTTKLQ